METDEEKTREHLLARIDAFLSEHGMTENAFGRRAVSNPKWVRRLRNRTFGVTLTSIEKAEAFMRDFEASKSEAA